MENIFVGLDQQKNSAMPTTQSPCALQARQAGNPHGYCVNGVVCGGNSAEGGF